MSVPLDKLYDFLDSEVEQDLIIYRWMPHGSRKLEDLQPLQDYHDFQALYTTPMAIFHDQEPLNYELYDLDSLLDAYHYYQPTSQFKLNFDKCDQPLMDLLWDMHVRGVGTTAFANLYDRTILVHSELHSSQVHKWQRHNYLPVYYWSHAVIAQDWFRYAEHDPVLKQRNPSKDFLIYNRAWSGSREYRLKFTEMLLEHDLDQNSLISFSPWCDNTHYTQHEFVNSDFVINNHSLHTQLNPCFAPSASSADYCAEDYVRTKFEVVLETLFDDQRWHLTEKTLRPIACGQPFLLLATPGSLEYLRSYGFETFADFWDESYDTIVDPLARMQAVIKVMQDLANHARSDEWSTRLSAVCAHNRARFFSEDFFNQVLSEYRTNMNHALQEIAQHRSGEFFRRMLRYLHTNQHDIWSNFMTRDQCATLWRHLRS
jgi:hypothetical protein